MEKKDVDKTRKELQIMISQFNFCWCCGRSEIPLTRHHAIPQRVKNIIMNVTVPICENCQSIIHKDDELIGILKKMLLKK